MTADQTGCGCGPVDATQACYPGAAATRNVGACKDGHQTCVLSGEFASWSSCTGAVTPTTESCGDGVDNDCDGQTDCQDSDCASVSECQRVTTCKALHQQQPALPSGDYVIRPGTNDLMVYCDMVTDGGGWTVVFVPGTVDLNSTTIDYTIKDAALWSASTDTLIAYRDHTLAIVQTMDWARFAIPANWRTKAPFQWNGSDDTVSVVVAGAAAVSSTLRYGFRNYSEYCTDPWWPSDTPLWGRICLTGTTAPFFTAFATPDSQGFGQVGPDECDISSDIFTQRPCTSDIQFTIAIR